MVRGGRKRAGALGGWSVARDGCAQRSKGWNRPQAPQLPPTPTACPATAVCDGYAGWDPEHRYRVRVVCARPTHALFAHNMLIRWAGNGGPGRAAVGGAGRGPQVRRRARLPAALPGEDLMHRPTLTPLCLPARVASGRHL